MNNFEKALVAIAVTGETVGPIFVHSAQGLAIFNASETLLANLLTQFAPKPPSA